MGGSLADEARRLGADRDLDTLADLAEMQVQVQLSRCVGVRGPGGNSEAYSRPDYLRDLCWAIGYQAGVLAVMEDTVECVNNPESIVNHLMPSYGGYDEGLQAGFDDAVTLVREGWS